MCLKAESSKVLKKLWRREIKILNWGEKTTIAFPDNMEIIIEAIPAIHGLNSLTGKIVGNGNGYWIEILQAKEKFSLYASGDTLLNKDTIRAIRNRSCDLFIANAGNATVGNGLLSKLIGRITMNSADAVSLRNTLFPKTAIMIHWDAFDHYQERDIVQSCGENNFRYVTPGETVNLTQGANRHDG